MTYEEQAEERTDKEIAERLAKAAYPDLSAKILDLIGMDLAYEEGVRIGQFRSAHMTATLALLPKIRKAVEALEESRQELRSARNYVPPNAVDLIEQARQQVEVSLASLRGVLTT
jgi:hypothetical protein